MDLETALAYALEVDPEKRGIGEHCLKLLEKNAASLRATTLFAIDKSKRHGERQLAALISQRLVKEFWGIRSGDETFEVGALL